MIINNCFFGLIGFLFEVIAQINPISAKTDDSSFMKNDCNRVANFLYDNFPLVVSKYNSETKSSWKATYIEKKLDIVIKEGANETKGIFLDFDDNNGFAVIGDNYTFYNITIFGESPFKNISAACYYYSSITGFYYSINGQFLSADKSSNTVDNFASNYSFSSKHYRGQETNAVGCGKITDCNEYVKDKYGDGWSLEKSKRLNMTGYNQFDLSCYIEHQIKKNDAGVEVLWNYSEGNCWAVSAYTLLQYLAKTKWSRMPSESDYISYKPSNEEKFLYSKYYDSSGNNTTKKLYYENGTFCSYQFECRQETFSFPRLYTDVRSLMNSKYKKISSGTINESSSIIERIAEKYEYTVDAVENLMWKVFASGSEIILDQGGPLLWSTSNDTYGSHTMAVCGYRLYSKTTGWWIFQNKENKLFYEIKDGHTTDSRFFDISGYSGFAAIVSLQ